MRANTENETTTQQKKWWNSWDADFFARAYMARVNTAEFEPILKRGYFLWLVPDQSPTTDQGWIFERTDASGRVVHTFGSVLGVTESIWRLWAPKRSVRRLSRARWQPRYRLAGWTIADNEGYVANYLDHGSRGQLTALPLSVPLEGVGRLSDGGPQ